MKKELQFAKQMSLLEKEEGNLDDADAVIRAARFLGIVLWANQHGIAVSSLDALNGVAESRITQAMDNPALIPIHKDCSPTSLETRDLIPLLPPNVKDSLFKRVQKNGLSNFQVRVAIVRHFVNVDFVKLGVAQISQELLNGDSLDAQKIKKMAEKEISKNEKKHTSETIRLGNVEIRDDIPSTLGPFAWTPEYEVSLPSLVTQVLGKLVEEYARIFSQFIPANSEGNPSAYQHCTRSIDGSLVESFFQIDIAGLSNDFISAAHTDTEKEDMLRSRIFEFEPSIAMYGLIQTIGNKSMLREKFRKSLDRLRTRHNMPIVLLAITQEKLTAIRETEFGKVGNQTLTSDEVRQISGFDELWGPDDFLRHLQENGGKCTRLLYVRPSSPISVLRDPTLHTQSSLLDDENVRKIVREHAVTLNIDDPSWNIGDPRRIKDSKAALPSMNMGFTVHSIGDLLITDAQGQRQPTDAFLAFMQSHGITQASLLRAKPMQGVFGAYGQNTIKITDHTSISWLEEMVSLRGPYILQPEIEPLVVKDVVRGKEFIVLDRTFFAMLDGNATFIGGIRILEPINSVEARRGRLHGTRSSVSASISEEGIS